MLLRQCSRSTSNRKRPNSRRPGNEHETPSIAYVHLAYLSFGNQPKWPRQTCRCPKYLSRSKCKLSSCDLRRSFRAHPDAKRRSRSYGSGLEKKLNNTQDSLSREVSGIHTKRCCRSCVDRSRDSKRSLNDAG